MVLLNASCSSCYVCYEIQLCLGMRFRLVLLFFCTLVLCFVLVVFVFGILCLQLLIVSVGFFSLE